MPFAETISWMRVSSVKQISLLRMGKTAMSLGAYATTLSTFIASRVGSRQERCALWTTLNGSSTNTAADVCSYSFYNFCGME